MAISLPSNNPSHRIKGKTPAPFKPNNLKKGEIGVDEVEFECIDGYIKNVSCLHDNSSFK
jgi:hypothetical protein